MKIERFEDLLVWQEARVVVNNIYRFIDHNKKFANDLRFKSQITSAGISIMANIAEGFSRRSNKEFKQFLFIAKGSIAEVQSHLYVALDLKYIDSQEFQKIYALLDKIARLTSRLITYLRSREQSTSASINTKNSTNSKNPIIH